jgi:exodeoxyribonuclease VII small subunit
MTVHSQTVAQTVAAPDFEATIAELEAIVAQMESGNLPLDQSIQAYKRGVALLQACQQSLADAEQQVRLLTDANKLAAFEPSDD